MPEGWAGVTKPDIAAPEDIVLYEVHVRDFSVSDESVPPEHRGTFLAFTHDGTDGNPVSAGMTHLQALREAGHPHLYPVTDGMSVRVQVPDEKPPAGANGTR
jgi:pullulanase/glycogen debranching enzyme